MAKKKEASQEQAQEQTQEQTQETPEVSEWEEKYNAEHDTYLRLAADYDNFRKRSAKEKENVWTEVKASTAAAFLPVYDNLGRALKAPCTDEAYAKGVEMTMNQLKEVLSKLNIEEIPAFGETFDPNLHNAVMHVDDESVAENTIVEVFQAGFKMGTKVIRHSIVQVAN